MSTDRHHRAPLLRGRRRAPAGLRHVEHTLARLGAERLRRLLAEEEWVPALGAMTGGQAVQMVKAGLKAIYLSGWQVAADANLSGNTYPDQSLYPANSAPALVKRINSALLRADQIAHAEGDDSVHWLAPIVADAEAGFGGAAERVRDHEVVHRGRRGGRPLRGPAVVGEEVRPPRRQGPRADEPARAHARRGSARRRRRRRADARRRAHRRALREPPHERHRRGRRRVLHRRAHGRGVLPGAGRHRRRDRARPRLCPVLRPDLVRDVDTRHGRGGEVRRPRSTSGIPASCSRTTARRRSTGAST